MLSAVLWLDSIGARRDARGEVGAADGITIVATATSSRDLFPGFQGGDIYFDLADAPADEVLVTVVHIGQPVPEDSDRCPSRFLSVTDVAPVTFVVGPSHDEVLVLHDILTMSRDAPDACQGSTFSVRLELHAEQNSAGTSSS